MDIKGLATGIGSLPYKDTKSALDLIFKYTPKIPFWPQLPKRDFRERMVIQYSQGLPCLRLTQDGLFFDFSNQEQELAQFYEHIIVDDIEYFKVSSDFAAGLWQFVYRLEKENLNQTEFIKGQICGPFTFAASINDAEGKAILHNPVFLQAVQEGLAMKARWQVNLFRRFDRPIIMFLDEPYLACLGSAFTSIERQDVVLTLTEFIGKIKSIEDLTPHISVRQNHSEVEKFKVLIGIHCCGNTDWSVFTEIPNIDIISFDAFNFLDRVLLYTEGFLNFFNRGGILAWGIVPTEAFGPEIEPGLLSQRLDVGFGHMVKKGISEDLIKKQLILTPSCGLGVLNEDKAEPIFKCLAELVERGL